MILLVGPYPPPIGGVSIHLQRLVDLCLAEGLPLQVLSPYGEPTISDPSCVTRCPGSPVGRLARLLRLIRQSDASLIHLHASGMQRLAWSSAGLSWAIRGRPFLVSIHSGSWPHSAPTVATALADKLTGRLLRRAGQVVVVNTRQQAALTGSLGVASDRVSVIPAHLPTSRRGEVDSETQRWIARARAAGKTIVLTSGYGTRLYRYEDLLSAVREGAPYAIVMVTYNVHDDGYVSSLGTLADGLDVRWLRDMDPGDFQALLGACDVYVRGTDRDGDSVAVREALALGKAVVASDAVPRPTGALIYQLGNPVSLRRALDSVDQAGQRQWPDPSSSWERIRELYGKLDPTWG